LAPPDRRNAPAAETVARARTAPQGPLGVRPDEIGWPSIRVPAAHDA
jgi:hypothetical protein